MKQIIENILSVSPYKVELLLYNDPDEGIKLEAFPLDTAYQVIDAFNISDILGINEVEQLKQIMNELSDRIEDNGYNCECIIDM